MPTQPNKPTLIGELREIKQLVEDTSESLKSQREILKLRGMSLPPTTMQSLSALSNDINKLEGSVLSDQTELGQLRFLSEISGKINSSLDVDTVLSQAMDVVINLTNAERGYIILKNSDTGELEFRVKRESELLPKQGGSDDPQISQSIIRDVMSSGQPLLTENAYGDEGLQERLQGGHSISALALRSVLCVPLTYKDEVFGVVYVDNRLQSGVFQQREKNLMAAFGNSASVAIENARLFERTQRALAEIGEMKDLMDNVFVSIGSGIITTDARHRVLTLNKAACEILAGDPEESIGKRLGEVMPGVSADLDAYLAKVRANDAAQVMDAEIDVEGRGRVVLSIKLGPLKDAAGAIQGVAVVVDDLTEQRDREETINLTKRYLPPKLVDEIHEISQLALGGERRDVTCMFVEVRPISSFPVDYRPQQIMEELNIYFAAATECIHRNNGVIDKYMGTEIMALFNTQLNPMEDHAIIAAQTAIEIRDAFLKLYADLGINPEPHYYRIGMHSGVATLGNVGSLNRREFTAIGSTINQSKRLEENSKSGQIIMSQHTHEHITEWLQGEPITTLRLVELEPIHVKGIQNKIKIYEVFKP